MSELISTTIDNTFKYKVRIDWQDDHSTIWWNETCAMVLEVFGLPGNRYMYRPHIDYMVFEFKSKKDYFICKILLSDRCLNSF